MSFNPDWASHPGETLKALLKRRRMGWANGAEFLDIAPDRLYEILAGKVVMRESEVCKVGVKIGPSINFWRRRQGRYLATLVKLDAKRKANEHDDAAREAAERVKDQQEWARQEAEEKRIAARFQASLIRYKGRLVCPKCGGNPKVDMASWSLDGRHRFCVRRCKYCKRQRTKGFDYGTGHEFHEWVRKQKAKMRKAKR